MVKFSKKNKELDVASGLANPEIKAIVKLPERAVYSHDFLFFTSIIVLNQLILTSTYSTLSPRNCSHQEKLMLFVTKSKGPFTALILFDLFATLNTVHTFWEISFSLVSKVSNFPSFLPHHSEVFLLILLFWFHLLSTLKVVIF